MSTPETPTTPDSAFDQLVQKFNDLQLEHNQLKQRADVNDRVIKQLLNILKKGEETFDLRVGRVLHNCFNGLAHNLEVSLRGLTAELQAAEKGLFVDVVDGQNIKENADTIIVRKTETGFDYSRVTTPHVVENDGTEAISVYLVEHPELFVDRNEILINLSVTKGSQLTSEPDNVQG